ncbi:hypothetical protein ACFL1X_10085 [Candidatus Hydrogenedentota bacterium]
MNYRGSFNYFDFSEIKTYPISERSNKVKLSDLVSPEGVERSEHCDRTDINAVAAAVLEAHSNGQPVIFMSGAHYIKNGLSPLVVDLIKKGLLTHVAMNGAGSIHDFELALIGETSENVPDALPKGLFGMAYETGKYMNDALAAGHARDLGYAESLARLMDGEAMPERVDFPHREDSVMYAAYKAGMPVTIHASMGADIIDQHPSFDGAAIGGTSGRDFGVFAATVARMTEGGVFINMSSAVTGPEVFLKAISMAANVGKAPGPIVTANFDMRNVNQDDVSNETKPTYYFRDNKSIVTRIPASFEGRGYYVKGNQLDTLPALYTLLVQNLEVEE